MVLRVVVSQYDDMSHVPNVISFTSVKIAHWPGRIDPSICVARVGRFISALLYLSGRVHAYEGLRAAYVYIYIYIVYHEKGQAWRHKMHTGIWCCWGKMASCWLLPPYAGVLGKGAVRVGCALVPHPYLTIPSFRVRAGMYLISHLFPTQGLDNGQEPEGVGMKISFRHCCASPL
jgi:hypothetical protein